VDARRGRFDRFVKRGASHSEPHASRSRPIRSRIAANSLRGTATAASWKTKYFEGETTEYLYDMLTEEQQASMVWHEEPGPEPPGG
jgi:hypothetical protein